MLYSKLGWYACHYLVPDDRIIGIDVVGDKRSGQDDIRAQVARVNRYSRVLLGRAIIPHPTG